MYRAIALWALEAGVGLDDLHRLEQLALAARIEFSDDTIRLNGEDVTAAILPAGGQEVSALLTQQWSVDCSDATSGSLVMTLQQGASAAAAAAAGPGGSGSGATAAPPPCG